MCRSKDLASEQNRLVTGHWLLVNSHWTLVIIFFKKSPRTCDALNLAKEFRGFIFLELFKIQSNSEVRTYKIQFYQLL